MLSGLRTYSRRSALDITSASRLLKRRCQHTSTTSPSPSHPYKFHVGASWMGKPPFGRVHVKTKPFPADSPIGIWRDKALSWPKGIPSTSAGEDFFYIEEMRNASGLSFGVADGVGGWLDLGVDPALFSQALMYHAARYSRNAWAGEPEVDPTMDYAEREEIEGWEMTPYECLSLAYGGVMRERHLLAGASTACLLSLNASSGLLRSASLGDSGFAVIRNSRLIYSQRAQTYFFNCPLQLAKVPRGKGSSRFSRSISDSPNKAITHEMMLRDGDIVIAYTDGLSDNVFPSEVISICSLVARAGGTEDEQVQNMADRIVLYARNCMYNKTRPSPFQRAAAREGMYFQGGKEDDVTVIVALVRD